MTSRLAGPGGVETVRARYLVGCDGAHSRVRRALGLGFEGDAFPEEYMLGDVEVDWDLPPGYGVRAEHRGADGGVDDLLVCIPLPGTGRYRMSMLVPDELASARAGAAGRWRTASNPAARRTPAHPGRPGPARPPGHRVHSRLVLGLRISHPPGSPAARAGPPGGGRCPSSAPHRRAGRGRRGPGRVNLAWKLALGGGRCRRRRAALDGYLTRPARRGGADVVGRGRCGTPGRGIDSRPTTCRRSSTKAQLLVKSCGAGPLTDGPPSPKAPVLPPVPRRRRSTPVPGPANGPGLPPVEPADLGVVPWRCSTYLRGPHRSMLLLYAGPARRPSAPPLRERGPPRGT